MKNYVMSGAILGAALVFLKGLATPARELSVVEHIAGALLLAVTLGALIGAALGALTGAALLLEQKRLERRARPHPSVPAISQKDSTSRR